MEHVVDGTAVPARARCNLKTEVYSRVCGYHRPVSNWNQGKQEEFKDRKVFERLDRIKVKVA